MIAKQPETWTTSITNAQDDRIEIRGYDLVDLIGNIPFSDQIYLILTGELPNAQVSSIFSAVLSAAMDHGAGTPSALAARTAISGGASINGAAAAGLLTLGEYHGAAVGSCMKMLRTIVDGSINQHPLDERIENYIAGLEKIGNRVPGLGHRLHKIDPRKKRLEEIAEANGFNGEYLTCITRISEIISQRKGRIIPVNIDGVMAALLCEIGLSNEFGNVVFMISRMVGIFTQAMEEKMNQKPMRHIDPLHIEYVGHPSRKYDH